jgi:hypothetical protein
MKLLTFVENDAACSWSVLVDGKLHIMGGGPSSDIILVPHLEHM